MTPKLQSLATRMSMLEHDLEDRAGKLIDKIEAVGERGVAAISKGHAKIDAASGIVGEIESYVSAIERANGGDPLDDSSATSEVKVEHQQPEHLTVNGVSAP